MMPAWKFQSTLPVWGATGVYHAVAFNTEDFNPRSPCGERLYRYDNLYQHNGISIHAPRVGSDAIAVALAAECLYFNPRSPCGERQTVVSNPLRIQIISIHAPRVGSD